MNGNVIFLDYFYFLDEVKAHEVIENQLLENLQTLVCCFIIETMKENQIENLKKNIQIIYEKALKLHYNNFFLVLNYPYIRYGQLSNKFVTYYFNTFVHTIYNSYKLYPYKVNTKYNIKNEKCLIIGGIPNRINRITLISKIFQQGFLDKIIYSLFEPYSETVLKDCKIYTKHLSEAENEKFFRTCFKHLDTDKVDFIGFELAGYTKNIDYTVNKKHYENSCISVVPETFYKSNDPIDDISEKTYRAIYNKHPFIIVGTKGLRKTLESYGFKTFIEYLKYDYDNIIDPYQRIDAIIENLQYFLNNKNKYINELKNDIEYNFNIFCKLIEKNNEILQVLEKNGISKVDIDKNFNFASPVNLVEQQYNIHENLDIKQNKN